MSHSTFNIHVATSRFPIQQLLAWHISTCNSYSSCGCRGLPRHTIMWNLLGSTWKLRSDSWEHWKGAPPFVSRQCFPNTLSLFKIMINSVLSGCNARFVCFDAKIFYLQTSMDLPEYVHIKLPDIPQEFIEGYNLAPWFQKVWVNLIFSVDAMD